MTIPARRRRHSAGLHSLRPADVRRNAASCTRAGITPAQLREHAVTACADLAPLWNAWADAIEETR